MADKTIGTLPEKTILSYADKFVIETNEGNANRTTLNSILNAFGNRFPNMNSDIVVGFTGMAQKPDGSYQGRADTSTESIYTSAYNDGKFTRIVASYRGKLYNLLTCSLTGATFQKIDLNAFDNTLTVEQIILDGSSSGVDPVAGWRELKYDLSTLVKA